MNTLNKTFLPVTLDECHARGWDAPDFVYVCGDAYVDHPSFGLAIISRILEKAGYRVAMLCLPPWQDVSAFKQFGKPRLGFLVSAGVIDSMVNHYTVAKKRRHDDAYAPGGKGFMRLTARPSSTATASGRRTAMCRFSSAAWKRASVVSPTMTTGTTRCATAFWWTPVRRC